MSLNMSKPSYFHSNLRNILPADNPDPEDVLTSGMLACMELGCPFGTNYIGSSSGEVYHDCTTSQARSINEENRVCFSSTSDAVDQGYRS
jgi:hypothetical protein